MGFAQLGVMIALSMGYDALVGVSLIMLAMNIGLATGIVEPGTALAQEIAGLPIYSGMWLRIVSFVILYAVTTFMVVNYAERVRKDPTKSYLYGEKTVIQFDEKSLEIEMTKRHWAVVAVFIATFAVIVYGCVSHGWGLIQMGAAFIWLAIIGGMVYGLSFDEIAKEFGKGISNMAPGACMVGIGTSIGAVLTASGLLDTIVHGCASVLTFLPSFLYAPMLFVSNTFINFFIISGIGQAAVVMPVMTPLCDIVGLSRQIGVLAFKFGDGFSNGLWPSSGTMLIFLAASGIPYDKWLRFYGKIFLVQSFTCVLILIFAQIVNYV